MSQEIEPQVLTYNLDDVANVLTYQYGAPPKQALTLAEKYVYKLLDKNGQGCDVHNIERSTVDYVVAQYLKDHGTK